MTRPKGNRYQSDEEPGSEEGEGDLFSLNDFVSQNGHGHDGYHTLSGSGSEADDTANSITFPSSSSLSTSTSHPFTGTEPPAKKKASPKLTIPPYRTHTLSASSSFASGSQPQQNRTDASPPSANPLERTPSAPQQSAAEVVVAMPSPSPLPVPSNSLPVSPPDLEALKSLKADAL